MSAAEQLVIEHESDLRLANLVTSYGVGTRSYNRSAEKRELDRQRAAATLKFESEPRREYDAPLVCRCPQRDYPHELSVHAVLRSEWWQHKRDLSWPWSLMASARVEPSTERKVAA